MLRIGTLQVLMSIVIKPGPARRVDRDPVDLVPVNPVAGPSRFVKRPAGATTRQNLGNSAGRPMTRATRENRTTPGVFFLQIWFLSFNFSSYFFIFSIMSCCLQMLESSMEAGPIGTSWRRSLLP